MGYALRPPQNGMILSARDRSALLHGGRFPPRVRRRSPLANIGAAPLLKRPDEPEHAPGAGPLMATGPGVPAVRVRPARVDQWRSRQRPPFWY